LAQPRPFGAACPALVLVLVLLSLPDVAAACQPDPPTRIRIPRPTWDGPLELVDETIDVRCAHGRGRTIVCEWRSVHVYEGPPGLAVDGELGSVAVEASHDVLRIISAGITPLHTDDAAHVEVERELTVEISRMRPHHCYEAPGYARHMIVSSYYHESVLVVGEEPAGDEAPTPELDARSHVLVRVPRGGWRSQLTPDEDPVLARKRDVSLASERRQQISLSRYGWVAHGPVVGAGVGFGPQVRARLRAGYELSVPPFVMYSLAVEGDAVEELMLVPAIEAATAVRQAVIPSLGLGVGAPVMLLPETRPGVRVQWSMKWWYIGLVGNVDIYPPREGTPRTLRGALMIEASI
jgi:hypothetical protein